MIRIHRSAGEGFELCCHPSLTNVAMRPVRAPRGVLLQGEAPVVREGDYVE